MPPVVVSCNSSASEPRKWRDSAFMASLATSGLGLPGSGLIKAMDGNKTYSAGRHRGNGAPCHAVYRGDSAAVKQWLTKRPPPTPECPPTSTDALISPVD